MSTLSRQTILCAALPFLIALAIVSGTLVLNQVRTLDLKKLPSVSETIDWAKVLVLLGATAYRVRSMHRENQEG